MLFQACRLAIAAVMLATMASAGFSQQSQQTAAPSTEAPASKKELIIGTKEAPPFAMKTPDGDWEGISIDLWRRIADQLGLQYRFQEKTLQDLLSGTRDGSLDAAVGALTITAEREKALDFSQPFYETGLSIAVPKGHSTWMAVLESIFSRNLILGVLGLLGVLLIVGTILWLLERRKNDHFNDGPTGFISSLLWSATTAAGHPHHKAPRTIAGELLAILWMLTSVIVISTFTALITSALTTTQLKGSIRGVEDLRSVSVGTVGSSEAADYLNGQRIGYQRFATLEEGLKALKNRELDALVYDRPLLAWQINQGFRDALDLLDPVFDRQTYGIALPAGSTLREPIDQAILGDTRTEWWKRLTFDYLGESPDHRAEPPTETAMFGHGHH